ncbi:pyruvate, water dikinase regulatory protein [Enterococcus sp. SMC-9]|uniref:pyruvate, water dikinase regulatory protein n=1 Tax=Enterococcus sp. SMC-9 TaxID=2862343 RepID=UPI001E2E4320|nr:pyruvate, water dikinase regulatory protein [Enterococcus sp. SMC-9]MCD1023890.1 kinase/pyrophosphorylase [Enterococcus sp. SMC-9]
MEKLSIVVISDVSGDAAQVLANAAAGQFRGKDIDLKRYPLVRDKQTLKEILAEAKENKSAVLTTFIQDELAKEVKSFCQENNLQHQELLNSILHMFETLTDTAPINDPSTVSQLNDQYYYRMNAINFASRYDDGKDPKGFLKADLIILGPSRTSKTPLSMYLANQSIKVANLPLIPEVSLPQELEQVPKEKIVGLMADPQYIKKFRHSRLYALGLTNGSSYTDETRIQNEMRYAKELYQRYGIQSFDVTNRSIEETAGLILETHPHLASLGSKL